MGYVDSDITAKVNSHVETAIRQYGVPKELYGLGNRYVPLPSRPLPLEDEMPDTSFKARQAAWRQGIIDGSLPTMTTLQEWLTHPNETPQVDCVRRTLCGWILNKSHSSSLSVRSRLADVYKLTTDDNDVIGIELARTWSIVNHCSEDPTLVLLLSLACWSRYGKEYLWKFFRQAREAGAISSQKTKDLAEWVLRLPHKATLVEIADLEILCGMTDASLSIDGALQKYA